MVSTIKFIKGKISTKRSVLVEESSSVSFHTYVMTNNSSNIPLFVPCTDIGFTMLAVTNEKDIGSPRTERKKELDGRLVWTIAFVVLPETYRNS